MSVTFGTSPVPISRYAFTCCHENGVTDHDFPTHRAAYDFLTAELEQHGGTGHLAVCGDDYCQALRMFVHAVEIAPTPSMNVSNANAERILRKLRLHDPSGELIGSRNPASILARAEIALMGPSRFEPGMDFYLPRLAEIATAAKERNLEVQWA